jgi:Zn-finger protein
MTKPCPCPTSQLSYQGATDRKRGKERHIWKCMNCGRLHVTTDKVKPRR